VLRPYIIKVRSGSFALGDQHGDVFLLLVRLKLRTVSTSEAGRFGSGKSRWRRKASTNRDFPNSSPCGQGEWPRSMLVLRNGQLKSR